MTKIRLPKPNPDGKISETWLNDYIAARYEFHDDMMGIGARAMFQDLMGMGLINADLIEWDENDEEDALPDEESPEPRKQLPLLPS